MAIDPQAALHEYRAAVRDLDASVARLYEVAQRKGGEVNSPPDGGSDDPELREALAAEMDARSRCEAARHKVFSREP
jgi:hypothetical protein